MQRYDPLSGQVFSERIVKQRSGRHNNRMSGKDRRAIRDMPHVPRDSPLPKGAETLYAKVMRKLVSNAHNLTTEALQATPRSFVQEIWKEICKEKEPDFAQWTTFVNSGHADMTFTVLDLERWRRKFVTPVVDHFERINSTPLAWMTALTLDNFRCTAADLKQLTRVVNLRHLEVRYSTPKRDDPVLDDGVVEYWAMRAEPQHGAPFAVLKTLVLSNTPGITAASFPIFKRFLALQTLVLSRTSITRKDRKLAASHNWHIDDKSAYEARIKVQRMKIAYSGSGREMHLPNLREITREYIDCTRSSALALFASQKDDDDDDDVDDDTPSPLDCRPLLIMRFSDVGYQNSFGAHVNLDKVLCFERKEVSAAALQVLLEGMGEETEDEEEGMDDEGEEEWEEGKGEWGTIIVPYKKHKKMTKAQKEKMAKKQKQARKLKKKRAKRQVEKARENVLGGALAGGVSAGLGIFPTREG